MDPVGHSSIRREEELFTNAIMKRFLILVVDTLIAGRTVEAQV